LSGSTPLEFVQYPARLFLRKQKDEVPKYLPNFAGMNLAKRKSLTNGLPRPSSTCFRLDHDEECPERARIRTARETFASTATLRAVRYAEPALRPTDCAGRKISC